MPPQAILEQVCWDVRRMPKQGKSSAETPCFAAMQVLAMVHPEMEWLNTGAGVHGPSRALERWMMVILGADRLLDLAWGPDCGQFSVCGRRVVRKQRSSG